MQIYTEKPPPSQIPAGQNINPRTHIGINWIGIGAIIRRKVLGEIIFFQFAILGPALQSLLLATIILISIDEKAPLIAGLPFLDFIVPGLVIISALQRSFESTAFVTVHEKLEGTISEIWGAPLLPFEILIGYLLSGLVIAFMVALPTWFILLPFVEITRPPHPFLLLYFILLSVLIMTITGLAAGMIAHKWDSLSAIQSFFIIPMLFLSGSFFSLEVLNPVFARLMILNPIFHMVNGFRFGMTGVADTSIWLSISMITGTAFLALLGGWILTKAGYRIKV